MLQQCKLRVAESEQKGTYRMYLGAKMERVKWKDSLIEGAIKVAYLNAVSLLSEKGQHTLYHLRGSPSWQCR